jgi:hypothetical protein
MLVSTCSSHPPIASSAAGANVSSIRPYSSIAPVFAVWNRWFSPGSTFTALSADDELFSRIQPDRHGGILLRSV